MIKYLLLIILSVTFLNTVSAQKKVAMYSIGKINTDEYENFSFYTENGLRTKIDYNYGKKRRSVVLQYEGRDFFKGDSCFKVRFSNDYVLYIIPKGTKLVVMDANGKYNKTFSWEYEGPVNGIGTYCDICAGSEEEAMEIIRKSYWSSEQVPGL